MMAVGTESVKSEHILILARDLLDDIELSRLETEPLLLKASRLARLTDNKEVQQWLKCETIGYNSTSEVSLKYMGLTGRWTDIKTKHGYWGALAQQVASVNTMQTQLTNAQIPNINYSVSSANPNEFVTGIGPSKKNQIKEVSDSIAQRSNLLGQQIIQLSGIRSKVIGLIHDFVANVYYEKLFSDLAETIFQQYKHDVDRTIANLGGDLLSKLPHIYDRLLNGEPEAVSQGLTSCRRLIDSFADAVFPPRTEKLAIDGLPIDLGKDKTKNRINAFIAEHVKSDSRKTRLRQTLTNLYDRVSAGVHAEVTGEEAQAIFLQTYMLLGEVSKLGNKEIPVNFAKASEDLP